MTTRRWLLIFLLAALVCAGWLLLQVTADHGNVVLITQDGIPIHRIDLAQVDEPYSLTVEYDGHYNIIAVTGESVWVSESDCSNQICVAHGPLTENGTPITCLPHHLTISWSNSPIDS